MLRSLKNKNKNKNWLINSFVENGVYKYMRVKLKKKWCIISNHPKWTHNMHTAPYAFQQFHDSKIKCIDRSCNAMHAAMPLHLHRDFNSYYPIPGPQNPPPIHSPQNNLSFFHNFPLFCSMTSLKLVDDASHHVPKRPPQHRLVGFRDWARLWKLPEVSPLGNWGFLDFGFWREGEVSWLWSWSWSWSQSGMVQWNIGVEGGIVEVFEGSYVQVADRSARSVDEFRGPKVRYFQPLTCSLLKVGKKVSPFSKTTKSQNVRGSKT